MDLAQDCGDLNGEAQEASDLHRRADQPGERLAARIFEHENGPGAILHELQRLRRPGAVQFVLQSIFVCDAIEALRCRVLRGRSHGQHDVSFAVGAFTPGPAKQNPFVVTQDLRAISPAFAHKR